MKGNSSCHIPNQAYRDQYDIVFGRKKEGTEGESSLGYYDTEISAESLADYKRVWERYGSRWLQDHGYGWLVRALKAKKSS